MKTTQYAAVILLALALGACTKINPGHVGIVVNQFGQDKGVQSYPAVTGFQWYNPISTDILEYPTFVQTIVWDAKPEDGRNEEVCFASKEKVRGCADVTASYHLNVSKVPHFYVKFRSSDLEHFTHGFLYNTIRSEINDVSGEFTVEEIMSTRRKEFMEKVLVAVNAIMEKDGVVIDNLDFVGSIRVPQNIIDAINATIEATQRAMKAENELRAVEAEAAKAVAQAKGTADANRAIVQSITPELMRWRQMDLQSRALTKWDGRLPSVNGGGAIPFINIKPE